MPPPLDNALAIEAELMQYGEALSGQPDMAFVEGRSAGDRRFRSDARRVCQMFPERPIYAVSALADIGLPELCRTSCCRCRSIVGIAEDPDFADAQTGEEQISADVWSHSERMRQRRRGDTAVTEHADESDDLDDPETTGWYMSAIETTTDPVIGSPVVNVWSLKWAVRCSPGWT